MAGIYEPRKWADLVTAHLISGPDIVDGLQAGWSDVGRLGVCYYLLKCRVVVTCLILITPTKWSPKAENIRGVWFHWKWFTTGGIERLRAKVGKEKMIWTQELT